MAVVMVGVFGLLIPRMGEPFSGHHEFNGVFYGQIARNYLRYGLFETKGAQVTNLWRADKTSWSLHTHHPATYPLLLAGVFSVVGESEAAARVVSVIFSMLGVGVLMLLSCEVFGRGKTLAVLPVSVTPLFLYYGRLPVFEPLLLTFTSLALWAYVKIDYDGKYRWWLMGSIFVLLLIDWPGFWVGAWILAAEALTKKRKEVVLGIVAAMVGAGVIILGHQWLVTGHLLRDFLSVVSVRLGVAAQPYTPSGWLGLLVSRSKAFFGLPVLIAAALGLGLTVVKGSGKESKMLLVALSTGVSHILVFRNIAWYHDYMLYHLIPFAVLAVAGLANRFDKRGEGSVVAGLSLLAIITVVVTNKFYVDLAAIRPHEKCVEFGERVKESDKVLTFEVWEEEARICPPFIGYYGDKPFEIKTK